MPFKEGDTTSLMIFTLLVPLKKKESILLISFLNVWSQRLKFSRGREIYKEQVIMRGVHYKIFSNLSHREAAMRKNRKSL